MLSNRNYLIIIVTLTFLTPGRVIAFGAVDNNRSCPTTSGLHYNLYAGNRDVNVHYPDEGNKRTMHGHTAMCIIPFGSVFWESHTSKSPDFFKVELSNIQMLDQFYVKGKYTYNVYARLCDEHGSGNAGTCSIPYDKSSFSKLRKSMVETIAEYTPDASQRVTIPVSFSFLLWDTAQLFSGVKLEYPSTEPEDKYVTFCTGVEYNNHLYKVDTAGCDEFDQLPTKPSCHCVEK